MITQEIDLKSLSFSQKETEIRRQNFKGITSNDICLPPGSQISTVYMLTSNPNTLSFYQRSLPSVPINQQIGDKKQPAEAT